MAHAIVFAFAYHQRHDECRYASVDVYHSAASKVDGAHLLQESAAPHPMCHREVGYDDPQQREHHVALKLYTLCEGTEYERRRDERKHALKHDKRQFWDASGHDTVGRHAVEEGFPPSAHYEKQW